jgi:hypothetical protein
LPEAVASSGRVERSRMRLIGSFPVLKKKHIQV